MAGKKRRGGQPNRLMQFAAQQARQLYDALEAEKHRAGEPMHGRRKRMKHEACKQAIENLKKLGLKLDTCERAIENLKELAFERGEGRRKTRG